MRLVWRLTLFMFVTLLIASLVGIVLPAGVQAGSFALLLGSLIAGWLMLALDGRTPAALGFYLTQRAGREAVVSVAIGAGVALVAVALLALLGGVAWSAQDGSFVAWTVGAVGAAAYLTLPAAAEEALLRGYPLQALAEAWGAGPAIAVTAVAFAALHYNNPGLTVLALGNLVAAGLLLGAVYVRTGSLWLATGLHLGWNWMHGYGVDLPVSGLELLDAPLYDGVATGPDWLGGGAFGPEGSAVTMLVLLAAAAMSWWGPWLKPSPAAVQAGALVLTPRDERSWPTPSEGAVPA